MQGSCTRCGRTRKLLRRHYCPSCYNKLRRCEELPLLARLDPVAKFWSRVRKLPGKRACWLWTGALLAHGGYGQLDVTGTTRRAHIFSWEAHHGVVPAGLCVLHHCDNPPCVRPDHLYLGTQQDNARDAKKRKRMPHGEAHHAAKLTNVAVSALRTRYAEGASMRALAQDYEVTRSAVQQIVRGIRWKHAGGPIIPATRRRRQ